MSLYPKNSSKGSNAVREFEPSSVVMYENEGSPLLAMILDYKKNKYHLINERGRSVDLSPDRLYPFGIKSDSRGTTSEREVYLRSLRAEADDFAAKVDICELWALTNEEGRDFGCLELCNLYYGRAEPVAHIGLRLALISDQIYFKRRKEAFTPREQDVIDDLKRADAIRKEKLRIQELAGQVFAARLNDASAPLPPELSPLLRLLEDVAADADTIDEKKLKEAKETLSFLSEALKIELHGTLPQKAFYLLREIGHFDGRVNLSIIRHKPKLDFSPEGMEQAAMLARQQIFDGAGIADPSKRIDLTGLDCLTIDDARTKDMDDALSVEQHGTGFRLGIHISDVACAIKEGSLLDGEAMRRATSLYLPDITINMLPESLSEDRLSLKQSVSRECLSFIFELDSSFKIISSTIVPSIIQVKRRLDYDRANKLLDEGDRDLDLLHNIAATCEMHRFESGGIRIHKRDALPILKSDGEVALEEVDEESPARSLVSEMMVLANSVAAEFAASRGIPLIYRGQEHPESEPSSSIPEGPALDYAIRVNLKKSITSLEPLPHATLGLGAYCQLTSPIRRFADLCNQRQLLSYICGGSPLYTEETLQNVLNHSEESLAKANLVARESKRLWLLRYLARRAERDPVISGTVVRVDLKQPMVELDEIYLIFPVRTRGLTLGQSVDLRITAIEPEFDILRLEEASARAGR
ncbi:MAG: RNB domain-containing ribonuclease [Deltaproteobacteria bacterium]|nr:RNB domain-containing ribonuclease [Deltaproteobacteria bacterium]